MLVYCQIKSGYYFKKIQTLNLAYKKIKKSLISKKNKK